MINKKQETYKESLKMRLELGRERADNEIDRIIYGAKELVGGLQNTGNYGYNHKERYQAMMNEIKNFLSNLPSGDGCTEYYTLQMIQKFLTELEIDSENNIEGGNRK